MDLRAKQVPQARLIARLDMLGGARIRLRPQQLPQGGEADPRTEDGTQATLQELLVKLAAVAQLMERGDLRQRQRGVAALDR